MVKTGRRIIELERIYGIQNGGNRGNQYKVADSNRFNLANPDDPKTEMELAKRMGVTQQTIQNYKKLAQTIPELQSVIEDGTVSSKLALKMARMLSEEEQADLISSLGVGEKVTDGKIKC